MPEVVLRAPTLEDIPGVVAAVNAESRRLRGRDAVGEDTVRGWWTQPPPFDLAQDVVVALAGDAVVGYGDLGDPGHDGASVWLDVRGGAQAEVLGELERRALERLAAGGAVRAYADDVDEPYRRLLAERGYRHVRSSFRMGIELDRPLAAPAWPADAAVRVARGGEEPLLHELLERAFADHWEFVATPYDEWLHWVTEIGSSDPTLWFVAEVGGEPAGAAICRPSEAADPDCGWVSSLGVLPEHRRRGLGGALLLHAFAAFRARGLARAGLGVDGENTTGAVRLYEGVGMTVLERMDLWELRP